MVTLTSIFFSPKSILIFFLARQVQNKKKLAFHVTQEDIDAVPKDLPYIAWNYSRWSGNSSKQKNFSLIDLLKIYYLLGAAYGWKMVSTNSISHSKNINLFFLRFTLLCLRNLI